MTPMDIVITHVSKQVFFRPKEIQEIHAQKTERTE